MVDSKGRKVGGTAGAVVTTAIGVYLQGTVHPRLAIGLYIVAGIVCLFTTVQWTWVQRLLGIYYEPTPHLSPNPTPATALSSIGAVTFAPVFNNQTGDRIAVNGELLDGTRLSPIPPSSLAAPPEPKLDFEVKAEWVWLTYENARAVGEDRAHPTLILKGRSSCISLVTSHPKEKKQERQYRSSRS